MAGTATDSLWRKVPAQYVVAKEGGEIWIDYYNIPVGAKNPDAAHAWIDFVYQPKNNGLETSYTYYGSPLKRSLLKEDRSREAAERPGRVPCACDREEARVQPGHSEREEAPGPDLDGVQGVLALGFERG